MDLIVKRSEDCLFAELRIEIFLNFRLHSNHNGINCFQEISQLQLHADLSLFDELAQFMNPVIEIKTKK